MSAVSAHLDWFDLCGTELEDGRYRVDRVVGSGSFGIVYHAQEKGLGPVAIKCLKVPPSLQAPAKESFLQQLRHEAKHLRELSSLHAGIPQAHGAGTLTTPLGEWVPYLVLEWLNGQSLDDLIKSLGGAGMPLIEAVELLDQGANALAAIHEAGVAHRDVKPANMFAVGDAKRRRTKVLDFGVAKALDDHLVLSVTSAGPPSGGRTGVFTPAYGAPEQFNPELGRTGPHTDVFALALVLIELVSGRPGLEGNHFLGLAQCALSRDVRPSLRGRGVFDAPIRVERVIEKALSVDVADRYADVGAFWSALRAVLRTVVQVGSDAEILASTTPSVSQAASAISSRPRDVSAVFVHAEQDADIAVELNDELVPLLSDSVADWQPRSVGQRDGPRRAGADTERAQLVMVLLTKALVDSGYCESAEMKLLLQRHARGEARIVPVMVRRIFGWRRPLFEDMIAVPRFGVPITQWHSRQLAWKDIAESLRVICRDLKYAVPAYLPPPPKHIYPLGEVFKKSDVPTVTFVGTDEYRALRTCLLEPGRGLVIEGPSGVGKTTALMHAAADIRKEAGSTGAAELVLLNTWSDADEEKIATLPAWHKRGIVAIDNFHSLEPGVAAKVIKHAKFLADAQQTNRKIVIVGIPGSRQSFADSGSDVPRRFDQIRFGRARTDDILSMIEKGEDALGISLARKSDIAVAAAGSIHLAQVICYWICHANRVEKTQPSHRTVSWSVRELFEKMLGSLRDNFKRLIIDFGSLGDKHDVTAVKILKALPACEDGLLLLADLQDPNDPALALGVDNLLTQGHIANLYRKPDPDRDRLLYYDARRQALLVENPQLTFYLAHERIANLAREAGRRGVFERPRIIIHHSPHDAVPGNDWLSPVRESLRDLTDNDGEVSSVPVTVGGKLMSEVGRLASNATALILLVTDNYAGSFKSLDELRRVLQEHTHPKLRVFPLVHAPMHGAGGLLHAFPPLSPAHVASLGSAERLSVYRELLEAVRDHVHKSRLIDA